MKERIRVEARRLNEALRNWQEESKKMETAVQTTYASPRRKFAGHYVHTGWQLLSATVAVVAGFSTLNMTLADSGFAILQEHAGEFAKKAQHRDSETQRTNE